MFTRNRELFGSLKFHIFTSIISESQTSYMRPGSFQITSIISESQTRYMRLGVFKNVIIAFTSIATFIGKNILSSLQIDTKMKYYWIDIEIKVWYHCPI